MDRSIHFFTFTLLFVGRTVGFFVPVRIKEFFVLIVGISVWGMDGDTIRDGEPGFLVPYVDGLVDKNTIRGGEPGFFVPG
jgi:hypothetical protein